MWRTRIPISVKTMIRRHTFALFSLLGVVLTGYLALVGQFGPDPDLDHLALTVSDFAVENRGGATDTAMVVFGLSALALIVAARPRWTAAVPLLLFGAGMVTAAIAPTDFGTELSTVGYIHRYASMVSFVALPIAALMLHPASRAIKRVVTASTVFMLAMLASATIGDRVLIGLAERLLLAAGLVLLGLMAAFAWRDRPAKVRACDAYTS